MHAWTPPPVPVGVSSAVIESLTAGPARAELRRAAGGMLAGALAPWRSAFPHVSVVELALEDDPASALPQSTADAVLAVVGSRGRGRLAGLLLGSTSQAMLAGCECPVAVVRGEHV